MEGSSTGLFLGRFLRAARERQRDPTRCRSGWVECGHERQPEPPRRGDPRLPEVRPGERAGAEPAAAGPGVARRSTTCWSHGEHETGYTEEQLANAVRLDPSRRFANLGPNLETHPQGNCWSERKRKLLEKYESKAALDEGGGEARSSEQGRRPDQAAGQVEAKRYDAGRAGRATPRPGRTCTSTPTDRQAEVRAGAGARLVQKLGDKYQIDEMAGKYDFTGRDADETCRRRWR